MVFENSNHHSSNALNSSGDAIYSKDMLFYKNIDDSKLQQSVTKSISILRIISLLSTL